MSDPARTPERMKLESDILTPDAPPGSAPCSGSANPSNWKGRAAFSSAHVEWGTPPDLKVALDKEFGFTLDPCKLGQVWDGCAMSWAGHRVFCNPPYGKGIANWLAKGREALLAVFLLPARTDTKWFHDHALKADEVRFFRGRLKFKENHIEPDMDHTNAAPFPSMLVIYKRQDSPNHDSTTPVRI